MLVWDHRNSLFHSKALWHIWSIIQKNQSRAQQYKFTPGPGSQLSSSWYGNNHFDGLGNKSFYTGGDSRSTGQLIFDVNYSWTLEMYVWLHFCVQFLIYSKSQPWKWRRVLYLNIFFNETSNVQAVYCLVFYRCSEVIWGQFVTKKVKCIRNNSYDEIIPLKWSTIRKINLWKTSSSLSNGSVSIT